MVVANLFGALEGPDLLIILAIVLLLFGGAKLPQLARSLGHAKREFQSGLDSPPASAAPTALPAPATEADTVTLTREEFDRLRQAAGDAPHHQP